MNNIDLDMLRTLDVWSRISNPQPKALTLEGLEPPKTSRDLGFFGFAPRAARPPLAAPQGLRPRSIATGSRGGRVPPWLAAPFSGMLTPVFFVF